MILLHYRLDEYLTVIKDFRDHQTKNKDDTANVNAVTTDVTQPVCNDAKENQTDNVPHTQPQENEAEEESTESSDDSQDEAQKKKRKKKVKRNTSKIFNKRAALQIKISEEEKKKLPKLKDATSENVQEILKKYNLPNFPPLKTMGPSTAFSDTEEQQMINYLKEMSTQGCPRTIYRFQSELQYYYHTHCKDKKEKGYVFGMYHLLITIRFFT